MYGITTCDLPCLPRWRPCVSNKQTNGDRLRITTISYRSPTLRAVSAVSAAPQPQQCIRGGGGILSKLRYAFSRTFRPPPPPTTPMLRLLHLDIIRTYITPYSDSLPPRNAELDSSPVPPMNNFFKQIVTCSCSPCVSKKIRLFIMQAIFVLKLSTSCERITSVLYIEMKHKKFKSLLKSFLFV